MTATEVNEGNSRWARRTRAAGALALCFGAAVCFAQSDLARLMPPDAPVMAGIRSLPPDRAHDALWLATRNNIDDVSRFVALVENDREGHIDHVIVADWPSSNGLLEIHLLAAQGRFNLASMSSTMAHPAKETYAGVAVLAVEAIGGSKPTTRWLAVPRHDMALFGSPSAVQAALDRFHSGTAADPKVLDRLRNAHAGDAAWSSVLLEPRALPQSVNMPADPGNVLPCLRQMREVDLGVQMGKTVTVDLHAESRDDAGALAAQCMSAVIFKNYTPQMRISLGGDHQPSIRLTLARSEYETWLDAFRKSRANQTLEAFLTGGDAGNEAVPDHLETIR